MNKWTLKLSMNGPFGEMYEIAIPLDDSSVRDFQHIEPPDEFNTFVPGKSQFTTAVEVMRRREIRKDMFAGEARRLGILLAERLEDKEGWHGVERQEKLKDWGR